MKVKKLYPDAKLPTYGSKNAAGMDLYAYFDEDKDYQRIWPGKTVMIKTGISIACPDGYFAGIFARSGLATKQGLRPANCVGVVDSDYRGEVIVALHNDSGYAQTINKGDRIAQMVILPYVPVLIEEVEQLDDTERSSGGFGSTGK